MAFARIRHIRIEGCIETLENLSLDEVFQLQSLEIASDVLKNLDGIENLKSLTSLQLEDISGSNSGESHLKNIDGLSSLNLSYVALRGFNCDIDLAPLATQQSLEEFEINSCEIKELNLDNWKAANLREISILRCGHLAQIEGLPKNTDSLSLLQCDYLKKINIRNLTNLRSIHVSSCKRLISVDGLPKTLEVIHLDCPKLLRTSATQGLPNLKKTNIRRTESFDCLTNGTFESTEYLELYFCRAELKNTDRLQNFPNLTHLKIEGIFELVSIDGLPESLKEIEVNQCFELERVNANRILPNLKKVTIKRCKRLTDVPTAFEQLSK